MKFILQKNIKSLLYRKKQNSFLLIVFFICYTFILVGINSLIGFREREQAIALLDEPQIDLLQDMSGTLWSVEEAQKFLQKYPHSSVIFKADLEEYSEAAGYTELPLVFLSADRMAKLFNQKLQSDTIYTVNQSLAAKAKEQLQLSEIKIDNLKQPAARIAPTYDKAADIFPEQTVSLPVALLGNLPVEVLLQPFIYVDQGKEQHLIRSLNEMITTKYTGENLLPVNFQVIKPQAYFIYGVNKLGGVSRLLLWSSIVCLLLILLGMIGNYLIVIEQKKKDLAAEFLVGRSKSGLILDQFLQFLLLGMIGLLFALPAAVFLSWRIALIYYEIQFHPLSLGLCVVLPILPAILPTLFFFLELYKKSPLAYIKYVE